MNTKSVRLYGFSDDKLTVFAGVARDHYIKYQTSFNHFNKAVFPVDYQDRTLASKLDTARAIMSDAFILKSQAKETADVKLAIKKLLKPMKALSFIVETRFEEQPVILKEFLLTQLISKSYSADTLISFTKDTLNTIEKHREKLSESGLSQELVDTINQDCITLDQQRREQIETIKARPGITHDRIEKMNDLWKELLSINKAADVIFENQPEVKKLFELPHVTRCKSREHGQVSEEE